MKYWEFLIQKEGDQTWLPLETQQVEILEGRYRVVAHTDRANTSMEIQVSQLITHELPPRKRVRKRIAQTNEAGLVVVMPFVNLKPGRWELTCSTDASKDLGGEGWQYSVQLQVFAHTEEDWSGEWPVPEDSETVASSLLDSGEDGIPIDWALVNEDLPLLQAQAELETRLQSQSIHSDRVWPQAAEDFSYKVALRQQAYLARHDQPMTIMGKVTALSERVLEKTSQLWIRLQNPETAQVIMEAHRPLSLARLPADFKVQIQLPAEVTTRVILGEVSLRTAALDLDEKAEVLASTAFTITAGIAQLLDTIANQDLGAFEEEVSVLLGTSSHTADSTAAKEPVLIEPAIAVSSLPPIQDTFVPAVGVVLPPLLDLNELPTSTMDDAQQPELPTFATQADTAANLIVTDGPGAYGTVTADHIEHDDFEHDDPTFASSIQPLERPPMVANPAQFLGTSIEDGDLEADEIAAVLEDIDYDLRAETSDLDALEPPGIEGVLPDLLTANEPATRGQNAPFERTLDHPSETALPDLPERQQAGLSAPSFNRSATEGRAENRSENRQSAARVEASIDFQSLKLKDHFWNRLSTLTHESHKEATQISQRMKEAGVSRGKSSMTSAIPDFDQDSEVVIYDEPSGSAYGPSNSSGSLSVPSSAVSSTEDIAQRGGFTLPSSGSSVSFGSQQQQSTGASSRRLGRQLSQRSGAQPMRASNSPVQPPTPTLGSRAIAQEDLPEMPLPVISVPMGDLVAGEIITVTVRTRPAVFKPFIKLWMIDRQSRSLVIEPQLLTNLLPDALGDLEATTEMQIPMDCLDVQIAAIAVDMATQQESSKAIVNRHVVPASQSSSPQGFRF
jgi:hypothetical protein